MSGPLLTSSWPSSTSSSWLVRQMPPCRCRTFIALSHIDPNSAQQLRIQGRITRRHDFAPTTRCETLSQLVCHQIMHRPLAEGRVMFTEESQLRATHAFAISMAGPHDGDAQAGLVPSRHDGIIDNARALLHCLLHYLHDGDGCKSRVLRVSCRMQSELLLEPTDRNNHTCPIKSCDQKQTHSSNKIKSRQMCTQTCIPASQCLVTCRNITLYSGTLIATINVRLLSRPRMCAPEHINIQLCI